MRGYLSFTVLVDGVMSAYNPDYTLLLKVCNEMIQTVVLDMEVMMSPQ